MSARAWSGLAAAGVLLVVPWLLGPILTPFLFSALLAYLFDPLVDRLEERGLSRTASVCVVFLLPVGLLIGVPLLLVPLLESQVRLLAETVPRAIDWGRDTVLPFLEAHFGVDPQLLDVKGLKTTVVEHWRQAGGIVANVLSYATRSGFAVAGWAASVVLIPVVTFYTLRDWDHMVAFLHSLLPRDVEPTVSHLARQSDEALGAFLRGQLTVMLALGTVYGVGLWLSGLELALLIGLIAGLLSFVPYLGTIVGIAAAMIAMLVQTGDVLSLLPVAAVFAAGQLLEGMWLTPTLVGDKIRLHPVAVIFSVMAGGQLFGFLGILLALPVTAVLAVVVRWLHDEYLTSEVYHGPPGTPSGEGEGDGDGDGDADPRAASPGTGHDASGDQGRETSGDPVSDASQDRAHEPSRR